jgi:hypothetical protein
MSAPVLDSFIKTYPGTFVHTTTVRHNGTVVAFAMDDKRRIFYSTLNLSDSSESDAPGQTSPISPLDVNHWLPTPQELFFPNEIAEVGYGVADQTLLPVFKKESSAPEKEGVRLPSPEKGERTFDYFKSTTARFTAEAPFQVMSDGRSVYVFRQAIAADDKIHQVNKYQIKRDKDGKPFREDITDQAGNPVPLVNRTLLVDRFVLVGDRLNNKLEVRFQRSRSKTRPQSRKDSLGDKDLDGNPFIEPTQELRMIDQLEGGRFTALLVPTLVAEIERWQIFAYNQKTKLIDSYSIERASNGLFNTQGTQFYTSPDPQFQSDVFEPKPGIDPFTGADLIPIIKTEGYAESALELDGEDDAISLSPGVSLGNHFSQEIWINPSPSESTEPQSLITGDDTLAKSRRNPNAAPSIWIERQTRLTAGFGNGTAWHEFTTKSVLSPNEWNHVAITFDGTAYRIYINGRLREKAERLLSYRELFTIDTDVDTAAEALDQGTLAEALPENFATVNQSLPDESLVSVKNSGTQWVISDAEKTPLYLIERVDNRLIVSPFIQSTNVGAPASSPILFFSSRARPISGILDEIRLWSRVRNATEIKNEYRQRLIGKEFGLEGYWRFDEASGTTVYDQTDNRVNGTISGITNDSWVTSDAPIGENTGVNRSSFQIATKTGDQPKLRSVESGLTALLYHQQEDVKSGYDGQDKPLKQSARVMLAVATKDADGTRNEIAALDFGISREGMLAQIPDVLPLEMIQKPDDAGQSINDKLDALSDEQQTIRQLKEDIVNLDSAIEPLNQAIKPLDNALAESPSFDLRVPAGRLGHLNETLKKFQAAQEAISSALRKRDDLHKKIQNPRIIFFDDANFRGESIEGFSLRPQVLVRLRQPTIDELLKTLEEDEDQLTVATLFRDDFRDQLLLDDGTLDLEFKIVSIRVSSGFEIEIRSKSKTSEFSKPVFDLGADSIPSRSVDELILRVDRDFITNELRPAHNSFVAEQKKLTELTTKITQAKEKLEAQRKALVDERQSKRNDLKKLTTAETELQNILKHGAEVSMGLVHVDGTGLALSGGILEFAWTIDTPRLFDSAMGSLALYFRGETDQFFVTYYTTKTERAKYPLKLDGSDNDLVCQARSADLGMDNIVITVSDSSTDDTCTVEIVGPEIEETWSALPRSPQQFANILNGLETNRTFIGYGSIQKEQGQIKSLQMDEDGIRQALDADTTLFVGDRRVKLTQLAKKSATALQISSDERGLTTEEQPIFALTYDYAVNAQTNKVPSDLYNGSLLIRVFQTALNTGIIANQQVTSGATLNSMWTAAAPGSTLTFDGENSFLQPEDTARLDTFASEDDLTLEAWLNPRVIKDTAQVVQHHTDAFSYSLGLQHVRTALVFNGVNDSINCGNTDNLNPGDQSWTVELWFRCDHTQGDNIIYVKELCYEAAVQDGYFRYAFMPHWDWSGDSSFPVELGQWYHATVVYDKAKQTIYRNGIKVFERSQSGSMGANENPLRFAFREHTQSRFKGAIADLRIWKTARTAEQIKEHMNQRMDSSEADLVGYWNFEEMTDTQVFDSSRNSNNGTIQGNPKQTSFYNTVAGVNGKFIRSREIFQNQVWKHWALTFNQSFGVELDGSSHLDCGDRDLLNINQDLTIDIIIQIKDRSGLNACILSKGLFNIGGDQNVPYALSVDFEQRVVLSFEDKDGNNHSFRSTQPIKLNTSQRLTVTRKRETLTLTFDSGTYSFTWDEIHFYIDNVKSGTDRYEDENNFIDQVIHVSRIENIPEKNRTDAQKTARLHLKINLQSTIKKTFKPADIGRSHQAFMIGKNQALAGGNFNGFIGETRIWNRALEAKDLTQTITGQENGLVAWWQFTERQGTIASDPVGNNHATFKGSVQWVKDPDSQRSQLELYHNGISIEVDTLGETEREALQTTREQFTLGALQASSTTRSQHFQGEMEELRIWNTTRTQEQIQDNLFRRLTSITEDVLAYYTFDPDSRDESRATLLDSSFRSNTLTINNASFVISTAPIGEDTPQVRSALAGIKTDFNGTLTAQPGIAEYGDLQTDSDGNLIGSFKRCYSIIQNGQWQLITGFKVGDLVTEWVGQVQFAPQLIGYIEGAPPVPSENLAATGYVLGEFEDYVGASTVTFSLAEDTAYIYSASKDRGFDMAVEGSIQPGVDSLTLVGGGLGAIALSSVEENEFNVGLKTTFEHSLGWLEDASSGIAISTNQDTSMTLKGSVENEDAIAYPDIGRRFVPDNLGMALVKSETADVFALRLKHNGALVSFQMRPNADIPPDQNIITFPINPRYTRQGSLDGKVGFEVDPNYPNALEYSPDSSYFKPIKAYELRNAIDERENQLETEFKQYNAGSRGRRQNATHFTSGDLAAGRTLKKLPKPHKRNLVNTYVWTAGGGLYAETEATMDMYQESLGGAYAFTGMAGLDTSGQVNNAKIEVQFEAEALFGGHINLTVMKTEESQSSYSLDIDLGGVEGDVYLRDSDGKLVMDLTDDRNPKPKLQPGRVDAYRFMSYFQEPSPDHFETFFSQVVDPIWLAESTDPNAAALREAQQDSKKPPAGAFCTGSLSSVGYCHP